MNIEASAGKLPMWSGDENESPEEWTRWHQQLIGLAGLKGLYKITREDYEEPDVASQKYIAYKESSQQLWFTLAGCTRGSAALVLMKHESPLGNPPDGRAAWLELENLYGGKARDERPAQLLVQI